MLTSVEGNKKAYHSKNYAITIIITFPTLWEYRDEAAFDVIVQRSMANKSTESTLTEIVKLYYYYLKIMTSSK